MWVRSSGNALGNRRGHLPLALKEHNNPPPAAVVLCFQREAWVAAPCPRALPPSGPSILNLWAVLAYRSASAPHLEPRKGFPTTKLPKNSRLKVGTLFQRERKACAAQNQVLVQSQ
jgi:hypothetical protein